MYISDELTTGWRRQRFTALAAIATVIVVIAVVPLVVVLYQGLQMSADQWWQLWDNRLTGLLWNTSRLAAMVAVCCLILGISSAWLVCRREFPGRRVAIWLMVLPMAIPTYVYAQIYLDLTSRQGWLSAVWQWFFGSETIAPALTNLAGVTFVLSLASYPYVFLLVRSALQHANRNLEEAGRIFGLNPRQVFRRVSLPLLRPAIAAGLAFVVLHVLSDFGAVYILRYETFTKAIFVQWEFRGDIPNAAALSFVLILFSVTFFLLDRFFRRRQRYYSMSSSIRRVKVRRATTGELILIWSWLGVIALFAFILPLLRLCIWTWEVADVALNPQLWRLTLNSITVAFIAATITTIVALPLAFYHQRRNNWISQSYIHLSSIGFVLPGPVVALGIGLFLITMPAVYGGLFGLALALVIRFLPLAVQTEEAATQQLTPSIEWAARNLGAGTWETLRRIVLPLISSGLASAWVLVFIDVLKELPATLLLRPVGFDTLPIRIWIEVTEEMLELAAPAALLLVIATLPAIWLIMRKERFDSNP